MLDIKFIRENPSVVQKAAKDKGVDIDVNHILEIDNKQRELNQSVQKLREERNRVSRVGSNAIDKKNIEEGKKIKNQLEKEEHALKAVAEELNLELLKIPNPAKMDVKVGKNETENKVVRRHKEPTKFSFQPKDHLELGEELDIIDVKRAAKVSGTRFGYFKNEAALLEFGLIQLALEVLTKEGFVPIIPPVLLKTEIMKGLGYMEHGADEDIFAIPKDDLVLIGTAEHAIVSMHKDEILQSRMLPLRYVGFSSAFRREAGSYGKDTRGIFRVHQFDKVEMVSFTTEESDDKEHEYLLSLEEKLFQRLDIPCQLIKMCTGDLGFPAARKYDIEAWIPSQNRYREVTSTSTTTDFQARRLNIRYKKVEFPQATILGHYPEKMMVPTVKNEYVHILNGTAFAIGRTIVAILENYQQEDGSVVIPKVLRKYLNNLKKITPKNK